MGRVESGAPMKVCNATFTLRRSPHFNRSRALGCPDSARDVPPRCTGQDVQNESPTIPSDPIIRSPSSEQGPFPPAGVFVEANTTLPPASESVGGTSRRGVVGIPILFTTVIRAKGVQWEDPTGWCQLVSLYPFSRRGECGQVVLTGHHRSTRRPPFRPVALG